MTKNIIDLKILNFDDDGRMLLSFFEENRDFFENFENASPDLDYIKRTFSSCPEGVPFENKMIIGCLIRGQLIGFAELIKDRHRPGEWLLGLIMVTKIYRKTVFGGRIILKIFDFLKKNGATSVVGGVVEENFAAKDFWQSIGATATDVVYDQVLNGKKVATRVMYKEF